MALLQKLHHAGHTIVMVTHEADIAHYADRTIHLRDGRIEHDGSRAAAVEGAGHAE